MSDINKNNVREYGWSSATPPESFNYIMPAILNVLHQINAEFGEKLKVLDIGSGNGFLCSQLSILGYRVTGVEPDERGVEISKSKYPHIKFYELGVDASPDEIVEECGFFDVVISTEVIEHLYSPCQLPQFAGKALSENGYLIISTPYHGYIKNLVMAIFDKWDFHHHPLRDGGHIKFWSRRTLIQLLQENGYIVAAFVGVGRIPYLWKSMIIVAKKNGN